jgi:hypothetical protein
MKLSQILGMKLHDEISVHDDNEEFFLFFTRQHFNNTDYLLITDFETQNKIYDFCFIDSFSQDFIKEVFADFNLTIERDI